MLKTVDYQQGKIILIDQTKLPEKLVLVKINSWQKCLRAIKDMIVRGAPAIGVTAALGMVLAARSIRQRDPGQFLAELKGIGEKMKSARPTAVNLRWGVDRLVLLAEKNSGLPVQQIVKILEQTGVQLLAEDLAINQAIGQHGLGIFTENKKYRMLTHCNAGALATVAYGTALGVIRAGWSAGKIQEVFADETRPRLQGGKLTAWELVQEKIPVTVISDNMAGWLMQQGRVDAVVVGADRIARNGDTCNKIGTYSVALLASAHRIPFYVAAPFSTFDNKINIGKQIVIEERDGRELTHIDNRRILAKGVKLYNPGFDVTPAEYITGIITEKGILKPGEVAEELSRCCK